MMMGWGGGWGMSMPKGKGKGGGKGIKAVKTSLISSGAVPGGKWSNDDNALFIGGLPQDTTTEDLYEIFATFGPIPTRGCRAMMNDWGSCKGIGFVNYLDQQAAQTAIMTLNGAAMPDGTTLVVSVKQAKAAGD